MRVFVVVLALLVGFVHGVDRSKFRTCAQTGFCRRHRDVSSEPAWTVDASSVKASGSRLVASLRGPDSTAPSFSMLMRALDNGALRVKVLEDSSLEPRWEQHDVLRHGAVAEAASSRGESDGVRGELVWTPSSDAAGSAKGVEHRAVVHFSPFKVEAFRGAEPTPFLVLNDRSLFYFEHRRAKEGGVGRNLAENEGGDGSSGAKKSNRRIVDWGEDGKPVYEGGEVGEGEEEEEVAKEEEGGEEEAGARQLAADGDCDGCWEEQFSSHHDSKPYGPTSVGFDATFPQASHAYGLPEHADSFALKGTRGASSASSSDKAGQGGGETGPLAHDQPYRLYNLDVFEYELDNPMALYGTIPFLLAVGKQSAAGVYWNNPTELFVDIDKSGDVVKSRWMSESGVFDLVAFSGPDATSVVRQFTAMVGGQAMPPLFALGYHQCRWNYRDEADVFGVDSKFEEHDFPYDVLWLDIEHTDGKRYFTWDKNLFPNPVAMQNRLAARGRKMVTIVDPHIKRDSGFAVHSEASAKGHYVQNKDGGEYDGWCWPGSSSYLDFTSPEVRHWWSTRFALDKYVGATEHLYTWNDMNEPSVFNGPEVSMPKDAKSITGVEHRQWHNLYGFYQQQATAEGQVMRGNAASRATGAPLRPFVLSRAFFAGSQRFGAIWTGDNAAEWSHLRVASPMLLSIGVSGLGFAGADVGGFFGDPDTELMERWYQAGALQPFFRAHAHLDSKRREPWLFGDEILQRLRSTVQGRYRLLPLWYTLFHEAHTTGIPPMRPLFFLTPDPEVFDIDDEWMIGDALLVRPVYKAQERAVPVLFPGLNEKQVWYETTTHELFRKQAPSAAAHPSEPGNRVSVPAPLERTPVFQRGGSIVPERVRPRRCASLMKRDPYTLVVALSADGTAAGSLFLDDGETEAFELSSAFQRRRFQYTSSDAQTQSGPGAVAPSTGTLTSTLEAGSSSYRVEPTIERILILGADAEPNSVELRVNGVSPRQLQFAYSPGSAGHIQGGSERGERAATLVIRKPLAPLDKDWTIHIN